MKPLEALTSDEAARIRGVLFDLDDTVLTHGTLTREAFGALWDMKEAGLRLVAVTGRPSGWGEVLARQWPIDAAVTESGAVVLAKEGRGLHRFEACSEEERRARRLRLARIADDVRERVPEARLTDDLDARRSDITWDVGERVTLPRDRIEAVKAVIAKHGARSTESSIHLHATFDADDKASGSVGYLARAFGEDAGAALSRYAFVGDSGNDSACFAAFQLTFGVANVTSYLGRIAVSPRYVARQAMGAGFSEIAGRILQLRKPPSPSRT